ncbi:uncharacterized protein [Elaeis guineensis]|uniref:Protein FAF-like, chloroplastic n=1 Tax=Elaeis guineensis var. tenera TaxID=51953 RepID=A0A6I9RPV5_ELAGV|nr:protein FAF-like, chloroplastic [Elaeis guineensis]
MSVAVRRSSFSPFEAILMSNIARETLQLSPAKWLPPAEQYTPVETPVEAEKDDDRPGQFDIWSSIQSQKTKEAAAAAPPPAPYVHPLVRRSSRLMSQKSLEICTESLGSETGSADFSSLLDDFHSSKIEAEEEEHNRPICNTLMAEVEVPRFRVAKPVEERRVQISERKELVEVNYHCSISRRSPPRSFPPPLPSISRRDGPCIHMRPHRRDGRLVVEAVPVRSQNYLHAQRQDGRLLLCFIDATFTGPDDTETDPSHTLEMTQPQEQDVFEPSEAKEEEEEEDNNAISTALTEEGELEEEKNCYEGEEEEEEEEEVEEEVEVVDRGTVVEVKVSTQPQQQIGAIKLQRTSSFVINKFVGASETRWAEKMAECKAIAPDKQEIHQDHRNTASARRVAPTTTTAAAAAAAASTFSTSSEGYYHSFHGRGPRLGGGFHPPLDDNKLLFTSKRRNREELLHHMMRCSHQWRPLFILEPCCIATSS